MIDLNLALSGSAAAAEARLAMVNGQLRPNRVTDPLLLAAMRDLPRERFVPAALAVRAYADEDLRLAGGRVLMQPVAIARLIQALGIRDGDRALVVGAGGGYAAAVMARCGARVVALEEDPALLAQARIALAGLLPPDSLRLVAGPLLAGHADGAPYDAILIEGEVPQVPEAIAAQLAEGGRLATVLAGGSRGRGAHAVLGCRAGGSFSLTDAFDCTTAPLPAFQPAPRFAF